MTDMYTSPLDPLFYLNHANVDRIWAQWQAQNPTSRQFDVGNPIAPRPNPTLVWPNPPAGNVTLDFPLSVNGRNVEVGQVMDTRGSSAPGRPNGILCYTYEI